MIKIHQPPAGRYYYANISNMLWGPLGHSPLSGPATYRDPSDHLDERPGIFGENHVSNRQTHADLYFSPALSRSKPNPSYPHGILVDLAGSGTYTSFFMGHAQRRTVRLDTPYSRLVEHATPTSLVYYATGGGISGGNWKKLNVGRTEYEFIRIDEKNDSYAHFLIKEQTASNKVYGDIDIPKERMFSLAAVSSYFRSLPVKTVEKITTERIRVYPFIGEVSMFPSRLKNHQLPSQLPRLDAFPSLPVDGFGVLADRAISKMDKITSNMIEFTLELRKPRAMIPKLKNLTKLKGWSEEYLRTNYAIMPTVSDLKTIFGLFDSAKPYFDKNGFTTYHAGSTETTIKGDFHYAHHRQLKVAIENSDNRLNDLIERIDQFGLFPNLSNLWDLVPFSFVFDWFIDVGSYLDAVDMNQRILRLNIPYTTQSDRLEITGPFESSAESPYYGELSTVSFQRRTSRQCPTPPLSLLGDNQVTAQNHWLEAGALIVSLKK